MSKCVRKNNNEYELLEMINARENNNKIVAVVTVFIYNYTKELSHA